MYASLVKQLHMPLWERPLAEGACLSKLAATSLRWEGHVVTITLFGPFRDFARAS